MKQTVVANINATAVASNKAFIMSFNILPPCDLAHTLWPLAH
jgi:hypothetical protein